MRRVTVAERLRDVGRSEPGFAVFGKGSQSRRSRRFRIPGCSSPRLLPRWAAFGHPSAVRLRHGVRHAHLGGRGCYLSCPCRVSFRSAAGSRLPASAARFFGPLRKQGPFSLGRVAVYLLRADGYAVRFVASLFEQVFRRTSVADLERQMRLDPIGSLRLSPTA